MNNLNQILNFLTASALAGQAPTGPQRPVYPYPLASTAEERAEHVRRRQAANKKKPLRASRRRARAASLNQGPSRKMFVDRRD